MPSRAEIHPVLLLTLNEFGACEPQFVVDAVTKAFAHSLTRDDLERLQQDGRSSLWRNRVRWARQDLADLGLIDRSERGVWRLTAAGERQAAALEYRASDDLLAVAEEAQSPYGEAALEPANEAVRMMLITLLNEVSNAELPWTSGRLDDGSMVIYYNGRPRVLLLP